MILGRWCAKSGPFDPRSWNLPIRRRSRSAPMGRLAWGVLRVGGFVVDAALGFGESAAGAAPAELDQFGGDGDRGLLRGARAQVEADRRAQPGQFILGHADGAEPVEAV